jgi:HrpA-like RNA helicase
VTKISRASATQRAGRANRQNSGHCYRLYAELDFDQRPYFLKPEIQRSDLSELYLMALDLFSFPLEKLSWLEPPPASALSNAHDLLCALNAIDKDFHITSIGVEVLNYPLHPRLARIVAEAQNCSHDIFHDTLIFLANFLGEKNRDRFFHLLPYKGKNIQNKKKSLEEIMLAGFQDRVARSRGDNFFEVITMNGDTLKIARDKASEFDPRHELWIVMDLNNNKEVIIFLPIEESWLYDLEPFPISEDLKYVWDEKKNSVVQNSRTMIGKILLTEEKSIPKIANSETRKILIDQAKGLLQSLKSSMEYERLLT